MWRPVQLVLEPGGGEEVEAGGLLAREGVGDCGVDLVPHLVSLLMTVQRLS